MITDDSQRMTERRVTWRRPGRELFDPAAHDVEILDPAAAVAFVERHHYAGSCSPPAHPFGLYHRGELVGVAVYGPLPSMNAHRKVFPTLGTTEGVTLGRFVLTESAGYNAESWFVARCHERLLGRGVVAVESCADPIPRRLLDGTEIKPGHIGTIYKAANGAYVGRTNAATLRLLPDGTCLSNRAQGKLVRGERGEGRAVAQLVQWGADRPREGEDMAAWLETLALAADALDAPPRQPPLPLVPEQAAAPRGAALPDVRLPDDRTLIAGLAGRKRDAMGTVKHHVTIETRAGRGRAPVKQRWSCSCGAGTTGWKPHKLVQQQVTQHEWGLDK